MSGPQQRWIWRITLLAAFCSWAINESTVQSLDTATASPKTSFSPTERLLFADWPSAKPSAVIVFSGQMYGYLQPCGCSRPQLGGLERRAQFISWLRAKGWPVIGVDLGDLLPVAGVVREQQLWKYAVAMESLREMGYVAIGAGTAEFTQGLYAVLDQYAAVKERPPFMLAGNVLGKLGERPTARSEAFAGPGQRPMVGLTETVKVGEITIGLVGVVGPSVQKEVEKLGAQTLVAFAPEQETIAEAVAELHKRRPQPTLHILIYQGSEQEAQATARRWPQFEVIVCRSTETLPPEQPIRVLHPSGQVTRIIHTGWKGQYIGVVAAFPQKQKGWDLRYQLVPLTERWQTPGSEHAARQTNPILRWLDHYAEEVRRRNYLSRFPEHVHPVTARDLKRAATFVGSEACARCHAPQYEAWKQSRHSHAYETLEHHARRPAHRHYDGECLVCHTVGLGYKGGFRNEILTPHLKHVGCESCHGPGSAHAADPKNPLYLSLQSPWRENPEDRLPELVLFERLASLPATERNKIPLRAAQQRAWNATAAMCMNCHDADNDPHFDLVSHWPKIAHPSKK
jgi:cytochrome c553